MKGRDYKGLLETLLTLDSISVLGGGRVTGLTLMEAGNHQWFCEGRQRGSKQMAFSPTMAQEVG